MKCLLLILSIDANYLTIFDATAFIDVDDVNQMELITNV